MKEKKHNGTLGMRIGEKGSGVNTVKTIQERNTFVKGGALSKGIVLIQE